MNAAKPQAPEKSGAPEPLTKQDHLEIIKKYTPKGQSPRVYYELVNKQIMGVDKTGKTRPFNDLMYFLYVANRAGLDPVAKQIYPVYRWDSRVGGEKMTIQTGIDGFRLIAQRTGEYAGQDDVIYKVEELFNPVTNDTNKQLTATCTVYRLNKKTGERMPITATARWNEYCQKGRDGKPMGLWVTMGYNQLGKCAEALALRKGFPAELSGLYTEDEMAQAERTSPTADLPAPKQFDKPNNGLSTPSPTQKAEEVGQKATAAPAKPVENTSSSHTQEAKIGNTRASLFGDTMDIGAMRNKLKPNDTPGRSQ